MSVPDIRHPLEPEKQAYTTLYIIRRSWLRP